MSIFKRIGSILRSRKEIPAPVATNPFENSRVGDIIEVDLEEYVITGKAIYLDRGYPPHRFAYYIQNGREISCLIIEKGRSYECFICQFVEGVLDDPKDVPTRLDVDGELQYDLQDHRSDITRTEGQTDFRNGDEVLVWRYFAGEDRYFFLQWQDGKFVAQQGERTPSSQVKFMKASQG